MTCIIIEDQAPAQRVLTKFITDMGSLELKGTFSDALQAMEFLKTNPVDLIFLDIHLPKISGIDFLKTVQNPPHVILTTAFPDYALESYEFDVVDYLLKPFSFQRFVKAVSKIPAMASRIEVPSSMMAAPTPSAELFIKSGHELVKVRIEEIRFIKSDADYTELFIGKKKLLSSEPLRYWEKELETQRFIRIHKSFIINIEQIEKIAGNQVYLAGETILPIGRAYKEDFLRRITGKE